MEKKTLRTTPSSTGTYGRSSLFLIGSIVVMALAGVTSIKAQALPPIQWQQSFGGREYEECHIVRQTSDGSYVLGGKSNSGVSSDKSSVNYGTFDYWVVKVDASGSKVWENSFGGSNWDELYSLQQTSDGGYILGGRSQSGISGNKTSTNYGSSDYWVVKLDGNGDKVWENSFGGDSADYLFTLQQTSDGGYILGGWSSSGVSGNKTSTNYGGADCWVVKIDGDGNKVWENSFGGTGGDGVASLQQTSDGGYILGGYSSSGVSGNKSSTNYGSYDCWVLKIDGSGNKIWENSFGGDGYDELRSLQQTSDGGYILGGVSNSGVSGNKTSAAYGNKDYWVVKIDHNGNKVCENSFGGSNWDELRSLQQTSDGGYILGGYSWSDVSGNKTSALIGNEDFWVIKLEPLPVLQTARSGESLLLSWSEFLSGYSLQQSSDLTTNGWTNVSQTLGTNNGLISVSMPINPDAKFFRLMK